MVAALQERMSPSVRSRLTAGALGPTPVLEAVLPGPFRACFTTRWGAVAADDRTFFDLDARSAVDSSQAARNRDRLADAIGRRLVSPLQVHGLRVTGAAEYAAQSPDAPCDGLTLHPDIDGGLAALLLFADCVPVVLCGEVDMAVAHAGWRGILGGVIQQAGRAMMSAPATAFVGPSIGPCCFTVGDDVGSLFAERYGPEVVLQPGSSRGSMRVDLWAAAEKALVESGIDRAQVINPRICTACNVDLFFSYRREGPAAGRQGCLAWTAER